jgi:hypothetical protein
MVRSSRLATLAGFALALCAAQPLRANTDMQKYVAFDRTDFVDAGVGGISAPPALGGGAGTLTVTGLSGTVALALLYWNGIDVEMPELGLTGGDSDYDEPDVVFDGADLHGTRVAGFGSNDCWPRDPQPSSAALYRADVTELVAARGNGDYTFSGFDDGPGHSVNGLSLIVYFDDGNPANDRKVAHYEGMQSNYDDEAARFDFTVDYAGGTVDAIVHASDGQALLADDDFFWIAPGALPDLGDRELRYRHAYDGEPLWAGESVPVLGHGRNDSAPGLWDIRTMPLTPLFGPPKSYPAKIRFQIDQDCVSLQVIQIVQPADPAPSMLSPNPFSFGDVVVGEQSALQRFTLTNLLPSTIDVEAPTIGNAQFAIVAQTCEGASLPPGGTCTVDVRYAPAGELPPRNYPLIVPFTDAVETTPASTFALMRGAGVHAGSFSRVEFDEYQCAYPDTTLGSYTADIHYVATNTGTLPVAITDSGSSSNEFIADRNGCAAGATLVPGASCAMDVSFRPFNTARREAGLLVHFTADDTDFGEGRSALTGVGEAAGDSIFADGFETLTCSPW